MKNLRLIQHMAHKFADKTDIEYGDLFGEASLAYCRAVNNFNEDQNAKLSTYAWTCMKNHLINFCKKETKFSGRAERLELHDSRGQSPGQFEVSQSKRLLELGLTDKQIEKYLLTIQTWPEDCQKIASLILRNTDLFFSETTDYKPSGLTPKQRTKNILRERGWGHQRIQMAINHMNSIF